MTSDPDRLAEAERWVREFLKADFRHGTHIDVLMQEYDARGVALAAARERIAELEAETARLLDLACTCESDPCCRCEAHRLDPPPKCSCGHTASMHEGITREAVPGARCEAAAWTTGYVSCLCPGYEVGDDDV